MIVSHNNLNISFIFEIFLKSLTAYVGVSFKRIEKLIINHTLFSRISKCLFHSNYFNIINNKNGFSL